VSGVAPSSRNTAKRRLMSRRENHTNTDVALTRSVLVDDSGRVGGSEAARSEMNARSSQGRQYRSRANVIVFAVPRDI
jgi:hypothetical protein